ncbi:MAG: hypothetical protein O3A82_08475 [Verrucomicrobia bacterium]|jgi:hypothetical protein|nr:DUF4115 domain-containing protein [Verrucomicrobiota bacterium]MDA0722935.1 hypothetical protein [Verrucomicrobiota bacterium]MDA1046944.1 hypothetical protein [Verrucomicrobiota bacterium]
MNRSSYHIFWKINLPLFGLLVLFSASCGGPTAPPPDAPPPHPNLFSPTSNQFPPRTQAPVPGTTQSSEKKSVVTLEALGDVWILVQNAQGVELQWQNLRKGERLPVAKQGSISITSSNGKALRVLDHEGRSLKEPSENEGIAILRLP